MTKKTDKPNKLEHLWLVTLLCQVYYLQERRAYPSGAQAAPLYGRFFIEPANIKLSLFGLFVIDEDKQFYNIETWCQCYKTFFLRH